MSAPLFASVLGADFAALDACLRWVHAGEPRLLRGTVTVLRGRSLLARVLGAVSSLPRAMTEAPLDMRIGPAGHGERWTRFFADCRPMESRLFGRGDRLVEVLGPAAFTFRPQRRGGALEWRLERVRVVGVPLPRRWFLVTARMEARDGRYHFLVEAALRGVGRIVRYEGCLADAHAG
jgi:hypothetical protein